LGDVQLLGRSGETGFVRHGHEVFELSEFHKQAF
jgi:hypothetical protein